MPLSFAAIGESNRIKKIGGKPETKRHLENLGFVPGADIRIVNMLGTNLIVSIKEARIAISQEMAQKIMI